MKPAPLLSMFEDIVQGHGFFMDSADWHQLRYSCHVDWLKPLLEMGAIEEIGTSPAWTKEQWRKAKGVGPRPRFNYHKFRATPAGMKWWLTERTKEITDRGAALAALMEDRGGSPQLEGKGIGAELRYWGIGPHHDMQAAMLGILAGHFEFVSLYLYFCEAWIVVRLTRQGYEFFSSLPRFVEVC